jgi:GNAT superfamily N-acetyltransferase
MWLSDAAYPCEVVVSFRLMVGPEISEFVAASRDGYIADRVASGDDADVAAMAAEEQTGAAFPADQPGLGHLLYRLQDDGAAVGWLWIGTGPVSADQTRSWWVRDIAIDPPHRGRGLGKAAMLLAEAGVAVSRVQPAPMRAEVRTKHGGPGL